MTPVMPDALNDQLEFRLIDFDLIDDPQAPERETMDPQALYELSESIKEVGLIKPLIVKPVAGRFEVIAGHRRKIACGIAQYSPVPCRVKINDTVSEISLMVHENAHTEPVNPVEEARFYQRYLVEACGSDVDVLCDKLKRRRNFVEDRLLILSGSHRVAAALEKGQISFGVAQQLNRVKDAGHLLLLLDQSIQQGATVRTVTEWVRDANQAEPIQLPPLPSPDSPEAAAAPIIGLQQRCFFCNSTKHAHSFRLVWLHGPCEDIVREALHLPDRDEPQAPAA